MKQLLTLFIIVASFAAQAAPQVIPGEYLIRFKSRDAGRAYMADKNYQALGKHQVLRTFAPIALIKTSTKEQAYHAIQSIQNSPHVYYMEPNYVYSIPAGMDQVDKAINQQVDKPGDPRFDELWGLSNTGQLGGTKGFDINALEAWSITRGDKRVIIAVIDTGIDYKHEDLAANMWTNPKEIAGNGKDDDGNGLIDDVHGYDFANKDGDPMDDNRHGSHCAGTIGAVHNSIGVAGVMANVQLMAVKFLSGSGSGSLADAIQSIDYATSMGVHVMSNSWGGGGPSNAMLESITMASKAGIIFVAAAGNSSKDTDSTPFYPAGYDSPNVISVAAINNNGKRAYFSNYAKKSVHVAAPGQNILSTTPGNKYESLSGTSMAAPHVSGVVGLVLSKKGTFSARTMRERLVSSSKLSEDLKDISLSKGFVDAHAALAN